MEQAPRGACYWPAVRNILRERILSRTYSVPGMRTCCEKTHRVPAQPALPCSPEGKTTPHSSTCKTGWEDALPGFLCPFKAIFHPSLPLCSGGWPLSPGESSICCPVLWLMGRSGLGRHQQEIRQWVGGGVGAFTALVPSCVWLWHWLGSLPALG